MAAKVLVALLAMAGTWGGLELALRSVAPVAFMRPAHDETGIPRALVHRASEVPGLAYELTPGSSSVYRGATLQVNEDGLRDDPRRVGPDAAEFRIAALGDSYTFGQGIESNETWANQLERRLNDEGEGNPFEVLNFGVGGYSSRDEALVLEHKALAVSPSLVVVGYVLNDPEIDAVQPLHRSFRAAEWWQNWEVLRLAAWQHRQWNVRRHGEGDYLRYLHARDRPKWKSVEAAFARMAELSAAQRVPVLVAIFPVTRADRWAEYDYDDLHSQVAEAARAGGLAALDLLPAFRSHPIDAIRLSKGDPHPSALGQSAAAQAIQEWIETRQPPLFEGSGS